MVEKVRASRDGHQFHEAWTARRALELLLPRDGLVGIAVEGLSPADQGRVSKDAAEIADLSLYYGKGSCFEDCDRQKVLQFKYSVAHRDAPFVASDAKKTTKKFAETERDYLQRFGVEATRAKLRYEIVTNRPIDAAFASALTALADGTTSGNRRVAAQMRQISIAADLKGEDFQHFVRRVTAYGTAGSFGSLTAAKRHRPSREFIEAIGLRTDDPFQRTWVNTKGQTIFRSEAWGSRQGYGRHEKIDRSQRLLCRVDIVRQQLAVRKAKLAILVKLRFYRKEYDRSSESIHSGVIALLGANGTVQLIPTRRVARRAQAARRIDSSMRRVKAKEPVQG